MPFQRLRYIGKPLLVEVKVYVISHHFPDDTDELAGTVPKSIVMRPALSHLLVVISFKGGIVLKLHYELRS